MSKKRKKRKEKVIADLRRELYLTKISSSELNVRENSKPTQNTINYSRKANITNQNIKNDYFYVLQDMKKTLGILFFILLINFTLYYLIQKNIINISFLNY